MTTPAGGTVSTVEGIDVDRVAAVVAGCPAVARLTGGGGGLGTYLPGRRVPGVVIRESTGSGPAAIDVHVVARYGPTMSQLAEHVRAALAALYPGSPVDVTVQDLAVPDLDVPDLEPGSLVAGPGPG